MIAKEALGDAFHASHVIWVQSGDTWTEYSGISDGPSVRALNRYAYVIEWRAEAVSG